MRDSNTGTLLRKGEYVICDNKDTIVTQKVSWTEATRYIQLWEKGRAGGINRRDAFEVNGSGIGYAQFDYTPHSAPLSLTAQNIVVNPVVAMPVNGLIKGYTQLGIQGSVILDGSFAASWSEAIPVLDCQ